ncbi:MAG: HAD family hydrolase [Dehalococcoidia bacterium]
MIRAVFFDFYNTLARYEPPREQLQEAACGEFGIRVASEAIKRALPVADDYFYRENARSNVEKRPSQEKATVYGEYERRLLEAAEVEVSPETALQVITRLRGYDMRMVLFEDVPPALAQLRERGLTLGLVSNVDRDMTPLFQMLGLESYLDFMVTSWEVGDDKPRPPIFHAALKRADVPPSQALHVGDQYHIDVAGAQGVGIRPLLIDRDDFYPQVSDCPRLRTLGEVAEYL